MICFSGVLDTQIPLLHAGSKEEFHMQSVLIEDRSSQYQSYGEFLAFLHKCVLAKS